MGSDCAKKMNVVSEKLNSLPATVKKGDSTVIQKTIITIIEHITVWLEIIEQHVILINNTKNPQEKARLSKFVQDQLVNVTQQLTVLKQTTSTITILRQEVITTVNWCLQSVENQILSIKHSHEQSTEKQSANIEKSKEFAVHEVKSEKDKPKPATFNLPIPDHANDFMDIIDGGGFSLDSEDEEIDNELPKENKSANIEKSKEDVVNEVKIEKDKPKPASFNLPMPDHANDFMEVIEGGGFSLDDEDSDIEETIENVKEIVQKPKKSEKIHLESQEVPSDMQAAARYSKTESSQNIITPDTMNNQGHVSKTIIRKRLVRKIVDGKPVETEEVIEEPMEIMEGEELRIEEPTEQTEEVTAIQAPTLGIVKVVEQSPVKTESKESTGDTIKIVTTSEESLPNENLTQKIIRHRIIKKIVIVDGKPVETETIESPIESNLGNDTQSNEKEENPDNIKYVEKTIRKRIIKRIVMEDGKPIETEQIIEDPEITDDNIETEIGRQDSFQRVIRKKIIKKIIIVNGKPVEIEEVIDEPGETIKEDIAENFSKEVVNVDPAQAHS